MARRVGIELSPSRCALVDVDARAGDAASVPVGVRTFRTIPWSPDNAEAFVATLRLLRRSRIVPARAVVALWGIDGTCHHFSLPSGDDRRLRAQALREVRLTGRVEQRDTSCAVLVDRAAPRTATTTRDVTVVAAPAAQVRARLAPLVAADFAIEAVVTPAMALASLARLLPGGDDDAVRAYVAVNADASAIAIVRKGLLLLAREVALPFRAGCASPDGDEGTRSLEALDFVRRLAPELKRSFLALKQQSKLDVRQVLLCGELSDLRALTAPLITSLQVEVATLDTLQGLAAGAGAALDATVRDHAGALRVAWAAGGAGSRLVSLLPPGAPTGGGVWHHSLRPVVPRLAAAFVLLAALSVFGRAAWTRVGSPSAHGAAGVEARRPEPVVRTMRQPAAVDARAEADADAARSTHVSPPLREAPVRRAQSRQTQVATVAADPSVPDPVVDSILYGPDRRLALIGHRVVRVGDRVAGGVVAAIEPRAVIVRRPSGELRRVEMKGGSR